MNGSLQASDRRALFISHANPEDNVFTLWLGAKLEALGYEVWADVLRLRGGHDWQRRLEAAIRVHACKLLFVGTPAAVEKQGVRNEIQIAHDVGKALGDKEFIIPLRLEPFDAPFLIAHAQYIDASAGWSEALTELLDTLEHTYHVPRNIDSNRKYYWSDIQTIHARRLSSNRESLLSNWLPISALPQTLKHIRFTAKPSDEDLLFRLKTSPYPVVPFRDGCLSFAPVADLKAHFRDFTMVQAAERATKRFVSEGWRNLGIDRRDALNDFSNLGRQGLENFFHKRGLNGYALANEQIAWWAPSDLAPTGKISFSWPGLSGLRQIQGVSPKRNMHWHFGVTANARIGPTPHVRLKSRLVFTEDGKKPFDDPRRAHRLRRSFAKSWRNPRWRDMMLAFLAWLSEGSTELAVPMAAQGLMTVGLPPIRFSAPVGIDRGAEAEEVEDEGLEEESEIEFEDEDEPDEAPEA